MNSNFNKNFEGKEKMKVQITPELLDEIHEAMERFDHNHDRVELEKSKMTIVRIDSESYANLTPGVDPMVPIPDYPGFILTF